ncbi:MAG: deoxyribonuclease [Nitrososphaera sp.]|nr:deoxyribonuclease [Nitrososphaera sp.]
MEGKSGQLAGFSGPRPFRLAPVKVGEEYSVKIESASKRGDSGVARIQGLVVFVANAKVGQQVKIRITKQGSGFAAAEIVAESKD